MSAGKRSGDGHSVRDGGGGCRVAGLCLVGGCLSAGLILLSVSSDISYSFPVISMSAVSTLWDNMLGITTTSTTTSPGLCPDHISAVSTASTPQRHGCPCLYSPTALWEVTCALGAPLWASICGCRAVVGEQQEAI